MYEHFVGTNTRVHSKHGPVFREPINVNPRLKVN